MVIPGVSLHLNVPSGPVELPVEHIRVTVGEHDLSKRETPPSQEMRVRRLVLHPDYQCERFNHDIALLELDGEVGWSETVWPACLPQGLCCLLILVSDSKISASPPPETDRLKKRSYHLSRRVLLDKHSFALSTSSFPYATSRLKSIAIGPCPEPDETDAHAYILCLKRSILHYHPVYSFNFQVFFSFQIS
jgi:hypothetical protein